jgi:hypothetical protein
MPYIVDSKIGVAHSDLIQFYVAFLRLATPAKHRRPEPRSQNAPGVGTEEMFSVGAKSPGEPGLATPHGPGTIEI